MTLKHLTAREFVRQDKLHIHRLSPRNDGLHEHDFFELVYVTHGSALHQLGTDTMRVEAGDYFIIDLGSVHRYFENNRFEIVNCLFMPEYIERALVSCPSLSALMERRQMDEPFTRAADRIYRDEDGRILRLIEAMEREFEHKEAGYQEMIRCHLIEILVHAARLAAPLGGKAKHHPAAAAMAEYLQEHLADPLSLEALSLRLGYTPQYLSALFRRETGLSLSAYLQKLRVDQSCRLLTQTRLPVSTIAQEVGYADLKHFDGIFKRFTSLTPREYRAMAK